MIQIVTDEPVENALTVKYIEEPLQLLKLDEGMPFVITSTIPETMNIFKLENWKKSLSWEGDTFPSLNLMIHADFTPIMQMSLMLPEYLSKKPFKENIDSTYFPQNMKHRSCTHSVQSPGDKQKCHLFVGLY